jgi:general secretion pathway protein F
VPVFQYKGFDVKGKPTGGVKDADNIRALRLALKREGVLLTDVKQTQVMEGGPSLRERTAEGLANTFLALVSPMRLLRYLQARSDADRQTIAILTRQLATLLKAGVQLSESLTALIEQAERPGLKQVLSDIKTQVNEGMPLNQAMARHPRFFEELYTNMIAAGEASGNLDTVLFRLSDFLDAQNKLRNKVISALFYPVMMTLLGTAVMVLLMTTVVPKVTEMYQDAGRSLPINTQLMIFVSDVLGGYWWAVIILVGGAIYGFLRWKATPKGREKWDRFILNLWVFGPLARMIAVSRFSKTLATMLSSGVPLLRAMEITKNVLGNTVLTKVVEGARESIREGESIAQPLKRSGEFPSIVCHMIAVGERSGQLETMLDNVAVAYELEVDIKIARLTSLMEPLMILAMGGSVGFVVFSIITPILEMNNFAQ